jgi:hypothetical protein
MQCSNWISNLAYALCHMEFRIDISTALCPIVACSRKPLTCATLQVFFLLDVKRTVLA